MSSPTTTYADAETGQSSGWSGSETSKARAHREDADGTAETRQTDTLAELLSLEAYGSTWKELADSFGIHHGQASSVLSNLHKGEKIARLKQRRDGCQVYVDLDHVFERTTTEYGRNKQKPVADMPDQSLIDSLHLWAI